MHSLNVLRQLNFQNSNQHQIENLSCAKFHGVSALQREIQYYNRQQGNESKSLRFFNCTVTCPNADAMVHVPTMKGLNIGL